MPASLKSDFDEVRDVSGRVDVSDVRFAASLGGKFGVLFHGVDKICVVLSFRSKDDPRFAPWAGDFLGGAKHNFVVALH